MPTSHETVEILLRMERTLGNLDARITAVQEDTKEIKKETKYTNGKVIKLRDEMVVAQDDIKSLYQAVGAPKTHIEIKKQSFFAMSWEKIVFILGSLATLIAFVIERLTP